jgi:hypothetical protein
MWSGPWGWMFKLGLGLVIVPVLGLFVVAFVMLIVSAWEEGWAPGLLSTCLVAGGLVLLTYGLVSKRLQTLWRELFE